MVSSEQQRAVEMEPQMDDITNLRLIDNGLLHIEFEFDRTAPSCFRIAREAHLLLYRSMIEALRGSANLAVTTRLAKQQSVLYQQGGGHWQEIHRSSIPECSKAWRFSEPTTCAPSTCPSSAAAQPPDRDYLIGFYDALAMIQTDCFMRAFVHSRWQRIPDQEMRRLEWLHERVRNEYEHFVPKLYIAPARDLLHAASLCLGVSAFVIFESNNVLLQEMPSDTLRSLMASVLARIHECEKRG